MNKEDVVKTFGGKVNGRFISITYKGDLSDKIAKRKCKANGLNVTSVMKVTRAVVRKGIDYDSQKAVQEKVENGKVLTHELPWGQWSDIEEEKGLIIYNKGKTYCRLYFGTNEGIQKPQTEYFVDGIKTTYEDLKSILQDGFFKPTEKPDCITIDIDNIVEVR